MTVRCHDCGKSQPIETTDQWTRFVSEVGAAGFTWSEPQVIRVCSGGCHKRVVRGDRQ